MRYFSKLSVMLNSGHAVGLSLSFDAIIDFGYASKSFMNIISNELAGTFLKNYDCDGESWVN